MKKKKKYFNRHSDTHYINYINSINNNTRLIWNPETDIVFNKLDNKSCFDINTSINNVTGNIAENNKFSSKGKKNKKDKELIECIKIRLFPNPEQKLILYKWF